MVMGHRTTRARVSRAVALASVLLALVVPSTALAANTAKFTSVTPKAGSSSLASTPTVSVVVYDKYGVKGASRYSMAIDGVTVRAAISYVKGFGYKKFKLTYRPSARLTPGKHSIKVSVRDLKSKRSTYTWSYTVLAPPPAAEMPVTVTASSCTSCHGGFPARHPMTECGGCHGVNSPPRPEGSLYVGEPMSVYGPASPNAHTVGCSSSPSSHCHASFFPHVLDTDCARCHSGAYPLIRPQHSIATTEGVHASTNTFCTQSGCHLVSLTKEHYLHSDASGVRLSCTTCHGSKDSLVADAITAGSTDCESCHHFATHPGTEAKHALPALDCVSAQCHGGAGVSLASLHAKSDSGCAACHRPTVTPTSTCTACHPATHNLPAAHAAAPASASISINGASYGVHACTECHTSLDLRTLHAGGCATCHTSRVRGMLGGAWARGCTQGDCHTATSAAPMHGSINASHTLGTTPSCVAANCHIGGTDVAKIHGARGGPGCAACHGAGKTPTLVCATAGCHPGGAPSTHNLPVAHAAAPASAAISIGGVAYGTHACSECHTSLDLRTIHDGACASCHATGVRTVVGASWTHGCAQGGCHITASGSMKALHGSITASHTLPAKPSCVGTGCHTGGTSVAAIHSVVPKRTDNGCGICHGGGKTPSLVCSNIGCHATGATPIHSSHPSTVSAEVVSINGVAYGSHTCSECHTSLELQTIHGGTDSCSKCHSNPASTVPKGSLTCAQFGCHVTKSGTMLAQHGSINASHSLAATPGCVAAGCHTGGTDVAAIHGVTGGPGCAACHGGGKKPTLNCVTCHPTYPAASAKHASHPSTVTAAPIAINGVTYSSYSCSLCHTSLELQAIHGGTGSCVKCHPNPASTVTSATFDCSQAGCHVTKSGAMLAQHGSVNASHTLSFTPTCIAVGCHTGGKDVVAIHGVIGGPGCAACHGAGKKPTLVCVTCHPTYPAGSGAHASHPSTVSAEIISINGTSYGSHNCSDCHGTRDLQIIHGGTSSCSKCHPNPSGTAAKLTYTCAQGGCHITKSGNMLAQHGSINASHTLGADPSCVGTGCHTGGKDVAAIHGVIGGPGCAACHTTGKKPTLVCVTCHPTYPTASPDHASHTATLTAGVITINGVAYGSHKCSDCHPSLELQFVHGGAGSCVKCHPNPASTVTSGTFDCSQFGCHVTKSGNMLAQHGSVNASHSVESTPSCVGDGCHTGGTDVAAIHGVTGGPGCTACHGGGKSPSLDCNLCHSSLDHITVHEVTDRGDACLECHAGTNLTTIHSSCATCHKSGLAAVKLAISSHNKLCSACHNPLDPHPDLASKHVSSESTGTPVMSPHGGSAYGSYAGNPNPGYAGFKGVKCVYCHWQGNLTVIHKGACATCHRGSDPVASLKGAWNGTCQQGACHPDQTHPYYAGNHWIQWTMFWHKAEQRTGANGVVQYGDYTHVGLAVSSCLLCHENTTLQNRCQRCHAAGVDLGATHAAAPASQPVTIGGVSMGTHACTECHSDLNLETIHMDANTRTAPNATIYCKKCHQDSWLVYDDGVQRRAPAWLIDTWDRSCTQGVCHTSGVGNMSTMHENIDATHTAPAASSCAVSGCHSGGRNVALIHSAIPGRTDHGCGICHTGASVPTLDCVVCHAAGTYHGNEAARHAVSGGCTGARCHQTDVSTIHGRIGCPACHTGAGATTTSCVDCHPDVTVTAHVNKHVDCLTCHPKVTAFSHDFYQYMPTINATVNCAAANCHAGTVGSAGALRTGGFRHTWVRFNGQNTTCLMDCHGYQDVPYYKQWFLHDQWFDKIAPTTTAHAQGSYVGTATITLTVTDTGEYNPGGSGVAHTYYRIDAGGSQEGTTVVVPAPSSGSASHTVYFYSQDHCGNNEQEKSVQVVVTAR